MHLPRARALAVSFVVVLVAVVIPSPAGATPVPVKFTNGVLTINGGAQRNFAVGCAADGSVIVNTEVTVPIVACNSVAFLDVNIRPGTIGPRSNLIDLRGVIAGAYPLLSKATVDGGLGRDTVYGSPVQDVVYASGTVYGFAGNDVISPVDLTVGVTAWGGTGDDQIFGTPVGDSINGGTGGDTLIGVGADGVDQISGGDGIDAIAVGGPGNYYGGAGHDRFDLSDPGVRGAILVAGGGGTDSFGFYGGAANETLTTSPLAATAVRLTYPGVVVDGTGLDLVEMSGTNLTVQMTTAVEIVANFWSSIDIAVPGGVWTETPEQVTAPNLKRVLLQFGGGGTPTVTVHG